MIEPASNTRQGKGRALRPFFVGCLAFGLLGCTAAVPTARAGGRIRPPAAVTCERHHLTSWSGLVSGYRRESAETWLQISTDDGTVEATTIAHGDQPDASAHFLLWGETFSAKDFSNIESSPGVLEKGMRAVAWICDDGTTAPVVDWQPPRA